MDWIKALVLAALQGVTELFPVSSLGHTVVLPGALRWGDLLDSDTFLPLIVMLHLGTAAALLLFFRRDWLALIRAFIRTVAKGKIGEDPNERLSWLIVIGTVPAGLIGLIFEKPLASLFSIPELAAVFLIINGSILFLGELLRRRAEPKAFDRQKQEMIFHDLDQLTWKGALFIGAMQALALIPGISRSGVTMVAGLSHGLNHKAAARFAFLLATPLILAAGVLEVPKLFADTQLLLIAVVGGVIAGTAAYLSTRFLMRYFELGRLDPFAFYCWGAGLLALTLFFWRG
ncbi:MAG TPA: undecaprenyl-diphosphate phosphatase [Ktedonobacterales bacterium]|jgi:undecaprenyl-diphosphatase